MASQQPHPTVRKKLTETESPLRREEARRKQRQWYVDTAVNFKLYRARFTNLMAKLNLLKNRLPDTDPHIASQLSSALQQEIEAWSELETLLLDIVIPEDLASHTKTHTHLPDTGDIPLNGLSLSSGYGDEHTSISQDDKSYRVLHELVKECQEAISAFYHAQHPEHMPAIIRLNALYFFNIRPLCRGENVGTDQEKLYFPETKNVLVKLDLSVGDQIICE